ncbi:MAG TPA: hypothetical protein VJB94_00605 [Candidatus Nanoarchaeia archaeon]|nr:hypothetical protein [Candidatus Nanoarchaeia archaeon]
MSEVINRRSSIIKKACETLDFYKRWSAGILVDIDCFDTFQGYGNQYDEFNKIINSYSLFSRKLKREAKTSHGSLVKNKLNEQLEEVVDEVREITRKYGKTSRKLPFVRTKNVLG